MVVKKGEYYVISEQDSDKKGSKSGESGGKDSDTSNSRIKDIGLDDMKEIPKIQPDFKAGVGQHIDIKGEQIKTQKTEVKARHNIINNKSIDWKGALNRALAGNSSKLSDKAKRILKDLSSKKPLINWKKELKKLVDSSLSASEEIFPKRRYIGQNLYIRGNINRGVDQFKTMVVAIDTSSSISHDQGKTFLIEVSNLSKLYSVERLIIIYCSDDIHQPIQDLKRGEKPDLTLWPTTGSNALGFIPPFAWLERNKIVPSVFIYLTDTGGVMPNVNTHKIKAYEKRVIWFVVSPDLYNRPPFGKVLFMPVAGLK